MARERPGKIEIDQFSGLVTSTDPFNLPEGSAQDMVNLVGTDEGSLTVRNGYKPVRFEEVE
jgi:hypothetical protein